jgi:hypothetical protein
VMGILAAAVAAFMTAACTLLLLLGTRRQR